MNACHVWQFMSSFHLFRRKLLLDFLHDPVLTSIGRSQFKTLMILYHHGSDTMGAVSEYLGLERGSFTTVADALIEQGLIQREQNPRDRRQSLVSLSAKGKALVEKDQLRMDAYLAEQLGNLSPDEQERIERVIEELFTLAELIRKKESKLY
ncbi:MarR family transcriptional regulator [Marispirochaeta sp.]|jgi:DNA-binding MarR family transcriptional regulator|uniref:MarR family winged helix-turn-helix transcriptional regulator n=1 Tax=Marispirochaeta sp. TaxID=2038653 RepID=UPI0029C7B434|nr:MarR family transcriptional regulator [Marispirochaeta sp.]